MATQKIYKEIAKNSNGAPAQDRQAQVSLIRILGGRTFGGEVEKGESKVDGDRTLGLAGSQLTAALDDIASGTTVATVFRGYIEPTLAEGMLAERVLSHPKLVGYEKAPDIMRVGMPYYDTVGCPSKEAEYWTHAQDWMEDMRHSFAPYLNPLDRVRLSIDEEQGPGVLPLRNSNGDPAFAGLARCFDGGAGADPHVDRLEWDAPVGRFFGMPTAQIAVNIYLKVPTSGGEISIWESRPDRAAHEAMRVPGSYGLKRELIGAPNHVIRPHAGDLVFFDAQRIHAVGASHGARVTISAFLIQFAPRGSWFIYS